MEGQLISSITSLGAGIGMVVQTGLILTNYYFERRRGLANGIVSCGAGLGFVTFPLLSAYLLNELDLNGTLYILAGVALQGVVAGVALISPKKALHLKIYHQHHNGKHPHQHALHHKMRKGFTMMFDAGVRFITSTYHISHLKSDEHDNHIPALDILLPISLIRPLLKISNEPHDTPGFCDHIKKVIQMSINLKLLKQSGYVIFCISSALFKLSNIAAVIFLPEWSNSVGNPFEQGALLIPVVGVASIAGRFGYGLLADCKRVRPHRFFLYVAAHVLGGVSLTVDYGEQIYQLAIYAAIYGSMYGAISSLRYIVLVDLIGVDDLAAGAGMLTLPDTVGLMIGASSGGWIYDWTGDYRIVYYFMGAIFVLSGLLLLLIPISQKIKQCVLDKTVKDKDDMSTQ